MRLAQRAGDPVPNSENVYTNDEDLVGKVCVNSIGSRGLVIGKKTFPFGESWVGFCLDGNGTWASRCAKPVVVLGDAMEVHDTLMERFRGFWHSDFSQRTGPVS